MHASRHPRQGMAVLSAIVVGMLLASTAPGPIALASGGLTVTNSNDSGGGSLRSAIDAANVDPGADTITFANLPTPIALLSSLPHIKYPLTIDGFTTQPVRTHLDGSSAVAGVNDPQGLNGLQIDVLGSGSVIRGLQISGFAGSGIYLNGAYDTVIGGLTPGFGNVITGNGNDGVTISNDVNAVNNRILGNLIYGNAAGGIDLGDRIQPGVLQTVGCPLGGVAAGPNNYQCAPSLSFGGPVGSVTVHVIGRVGVSSARVELFSAQTCPVGLPGDVGVGARAETLVASLDVPLSNASFYASGSVDIPGAAGAGILTATATTSDGTSEFAPCSGAPTDETIGVASAPASVSAGQQVTVAFTVTNKGPSRDAEVLAGVDLSTFFSPSPQPSSSGGTCTFEPGPVAICQVGPLDPLHSATLTFTGNATAPDISATAEVLDLFGNDPQPANNQVTVAIGGATPASGSPVVVSLAPATAGTQAASVTFATVTTGGTTSVTTSATPPAALPGTYQPAGPTIYYDLSSTAAFTGSIRVCFSYAGINPPPTALLHYDTTIPTPDWVPIQDPTAAQADVDANRICGSTTSLSPFALVTLAPPPVLTLPSNMVAVASSSSGAAVPYVATATDHIGAPITPICSPASGSIFPVGTTKVTCVATDASGHSSSGSFIVTVGYRFAGFSQPLNDPVSLTNPQSVFKGGSTIPVKFGLTYADLSPISDAAASAIATACQATISLAQTPGNAPPVDEVVNSTTANAGTCFRYDSGAHQFIFNLGTKPYPAPSLYLLGATVIGPGNALLATHSLPVGLR